VALVALLLSPGQDAMASRPLQDSGRFVAASRFAPARAPIVSGLQQVVPVRASALPPAADLPFASAALLGTRAVTDPQHVNESALADFVHAPQNVPTTVFIPPASALATEPALVAARSASYVPNVGARFANGVATWYGSSFHGSQMFCGQVYNMYDPTTAASTDFPCGTWLTVTNVATGASVRVQVRDRGLLGPGHVDLSLAAFGAIADPGNGVIEIAVSTTPTP
jgi:rare lipoprotein A (peptidoglycan hydrolase)